MAPHIGIIINPYARGNIKRSDAIREEMMRVGGALVDVRITNSVEEITDVAHDFLAEGVKIIAICGGDGSLCVTLSRLKEVWGDREFPVVMPLRGGTMNNVCIDAGIKMKPVKALARVCDQIRKRQEPATEVRDSIEVEGRVGFIFGSGMTSNILDLYYDTPGRGVWKAFKVVLFGILSTIVNGPYSKRFWRPAYCRISGRRPDGSQFKFKYHKLSVMIVSTINYLGLNCRPVYRAHEKPGYMHILASAFTPLQMILRIKKVFIGAPWNQKRMLDEITNDWVIEIDDPMLYTLDGELYQMESEKTSIKSGPRFYFIVM